MKRQFPLKGLVALLLLPALAGAAPSTSTPPPGAAMDLGSTADVLKSWRDQAKNPRLMGMKALQGQSLAVKIHHFHEQGDQFSVSGESADNAQSTFFAKGKGQKMSGYLIRHDQQRAWSYRSDSAGKVTVREVLIKEVIPDYDPHFQDQLQVGARTAQLAGVSHPVYSPMALRQARHIGPYNNEDVTKLESKPGSAYVFYLNTSAVMSGSTPLNGVTKEQMYRVWQSVSDQFSMYNLNVTTNKAVYDAAKASNVLRTGVINFINQDGRSFAPLGSFGTTSAGTLYRNPSSGFDYGYGIGMTAAHEIGHQVGLSHDGGGTGGEYFEGIAAFQWGPIMGNYWMGGSWANQLFTWSRGEYNTASNKEDDFAVISSENIPFMADDNPSGKPLVLRAGGEIHPSDNFGQIERNTDTDEFTFTLTANGTLDLKIDPIEYLRMLDVDASIVNSAGTVVARSNLSVNRSAEFKSLSLPAGSYRVVIQGGAEGTPQNGFSKYSSLGWYAMQGKLVSGGVPPVDPNKLKSGVAVTGLGAATGQWLYYTIDVPAGSTSVKFDLSGTSGDADLFTQLNGKPTTTAYKCKSDGSTSTETCQLSNPAAGTYTVGVYAYAAFSNLSVKATVTPTPAAVKP